jgi:hypothetical protein
VIPRAKSQREKDLLMTGLPERLVDGTSESMFLTLCRHISRRLPGALL